MCVCHTDGRRRLADTRQLCDLLGGHRLRNEDTERRKVQQSIVGLVRSYKPIGVLLHFCPCGQHVVKNSACKHGKGTINII